MRTKRKRINRRIVLFVSFIILFVILCYYSIIKLLQPYIPRVRIRPNKTVPFKKISVAHYTTTYGARIDSHSNHLNTNLKQVCEMIDLEEYPYADGVVVYLFDFVRFPTLSYDKHLYRQKHESQLWLFHTEESPRRTYTRAEVKSAAELDDWFNLTATFRPESDIHIQYNVCFSKFFISSFLFELK
jgi:hypothetical protein